MREIEFKGKRIDGKGWVFGGIRCSSTPDSVYIINQYGWNEVIKETVGQYTNNKDKDDNKIFEHDLITFGKSKTKYMVKWYEDKWLCISDEGDEYGPFTRGLKLSSLYDKENYKITIIGNNHDVDLFHQLKIGESTGSHIKK